MTELSTRDDLIYKWEILEEKRVRWTRAPLFEHTFQAGGEYDVRVKAFNAGKLTHWGWDKMDAILQRIFSNSFSWMIIVIFWCKFHWNTFPMGPIDNMPTLVQVMAWHQTSNMPLSEPIPLSEPMPLSEPVHRRIYAALGENELALYGLVMPYGIIDLGQHWLRSWLIASWHQAITWINVSAKVFSDVHLRANS